MVRFLGFVALLSVIYSVLQIVFGELKVDITPAGLLAKVTPAEKKEAARPTQPSGGSSVPPATLRPMVQRPRVILFTGLQWCPPCQFLERNVISTVEWRDFASAEISFQKVNVPRDASAVSRADRELMSKYGINSFPTLVVVDPTGRELGRRVGAESTPAAVTGWIRSLTGKH